MESLVELGRWTVFIGLIIIAVGALIWLLGQIPGLDRLPGTWTWKSDNVTVIAPIGAMIILSIVLNIVLRIFR